MFFQHSTTPEKFPLGLRNDKQFFDYIQNTLLTMRKNYVLRIKAVRRKVGRMSF